MEVNNLLDIHSREELYRWYQQNHNKVSDFWLRINRAAEDCPGVVRYVDAVEVALCFGWMPSRPIEQPGTTTTHSLKPTAVSGLITFSIVGKPAGRNKR